MNIVIIGTGNVAQVVGSMLVAAGHSILQVHGRNAQRAAECATRLGATPVLEISQLSEKADLCLVATSDEAVPAVAAQLHLPNCIVVHTSGGVSMAALNQHQRHGVLYPLQSLRKELPHLPPVPFFVDGSDEETRNTIFALAQTVSQQVQFATDEERLKLHVAAVFCSNFTNHLYDLTHAFCQKEGLPFDYLLPLIKETAQRMEWKAPGQMQTGPAARGDDQTIQRHVEALAPYPALSEMYSILTKSIREKKENV